MHNVVVDKPYVFVPPHRGRWWPWFLQRFVPRRLRRKYGIVAVACQGMEKLLASHSAGYGIVLAPNHTRPSDPEVINEMCRQTGLLPYFVASWHLFMQSRLQTFMLRRLGAFSIYREGMDRHALNMGIELVQQSSRPLVIFPEGIISRTNDLLNPLHEGVSFIARSAAKKRAKAAVAGQVVIHPVAMRYRFEGDVRQSVAPVLSEIETRLSWRPQTHLSIEDRIMKVGLALLGLKEIEYLKEPQSGTTAERLQRLIDHLLGPVEAEWLRGERPAHVGQRVRKLRIAMLPDMVKDELPEVERARRWAQFADLYLAQQLSCFPPQYVAAAPTPERILETVERFEEGLTDECRPHPPMRVHLTVGDAIVVGAERERGGDDPVVVEIERQLQQMLAR